jgi:hypothetical protein
MGPRENCYVRFWKPCIACERLSFPRRFRSGTGAKSSATGESSGEAPWQQRRMQAERCLTPPPAPRWLAATPPRWPAGSPAASRRCENTATANPNPMLHSISTLHEPTASVWLTDDTEGERFGRAPGGDKSDVAGRQGRCSRGGGGECDGSARSAVSPRDPRTGRPAASRRSPASPATGLPCVRSPA